MNNYSEPFPLDQDVVRKDPAYPPAPETLEYPLDYHSIETSNMIVCGRIVVKLRLLIATALQEGTWSEQEGIEALRFLDFSESL